MFYMFQVNENCNGLLHRSTYSDSACSSAFVRVRALLRWFLAGLGDRAQSTYYTLIATFFSFYAGWRSRK
jgi:hypothetical protein